MLKIIDRYIYKNLIGSFLFGLFIFTTIFLVDLTMELVDFVINKGIPIVEVLKLFLFSLPSILILTFPMATLMGGLITFGKLSADKEIIAMLTCGISYYRLIRIALMFGLTISLLTIMFNEFVVPRTNVLRRKIFRKITFKKPIPKIGENVFFSGQDGLTFFVRKFDKKNDALQDLIIFEKRFNRFPAIIIAKNAKWKENNWELYDGIKWDFEPSEKSVDRMDFSKMKLYMSGSYGDYKSYSNKRATDMSLRELSAEIKKLKKARINVKDLIMEFYFKTSLPFASLCFIIIGVPLAINTQRSGKSIGIGLSILIIFFYYLLMSIGKALGKGNILHPIIAMWFQNVIIILIGIFLMRKAKK